MYVFLCNIDSDSLSTHAVTLGRKKEGNLEELDTPS